MGIVGRGAIGTAHAAAFIENGAELAAVADIPPDTGVAFVKRFAVVRIYASAGG